MFWNEIQHPIRQVPFAAPPEEMLSGCCRRTQTPTGNVVSVLACAERNARRLCNASDREYRLRLLNFPPYLYFNEAEPALSRLRLIFSPLRLSFRPPFCLPFTRRFARYSPTLHLPFTHSLSAAPVASLAAPCRIVRCDFDFVIRTKSVFLIRNFTRRQFTNSDTPTRTKNAAAREKFFLPLDCFARKKYRGAQKYLCAAALPLNK